MHHPAVSRRAALGAGIALLGCTEPSTPTGPGPQGTEGWEMREQIWRVPVPARRGAAEAVLLEATLFRPPGEGPFPLAIFSHGQPGDPAGRRRMVRPRYPLASRFLVDEGFAVLLPTRRGFGASEGEFLGGTDGCQRIDLENNADTAANDILAVRDWAVANMSFLRGDRLLLAGQSAGGFGSLAAIGRPDASVAGVVNFSGGLRAGDGQSLGGGYCEGWQDRLVLSMERLGSRAPAKAVPTLWLYAQNDLYFGFGLAPRMHEAWQRAGGQARFVEIASAARDGHGFVDDPATVGQWRGPARRFLEELRGAGRL